MKFKLQTLSLIVALSVFTGSVNAKTDTNMDLVSDKTVTMKLITESFEQQDLIIQTNDFQKDVKELLAQKPYTPKPRFFTRDTESSRTSMVNAED